MTDERFEEILKSEERCSLCLRGEDADYCSECSDCVPRTFEEIKEFWQMVHEINDFEKSQCVKLLAKLQQYEQTSTVGGCETAQTRRGEWIISSDGYYPYYSQCKKRPNGGEMTDFCSHCGAMMKRTGEVND